MAPIRIPVKRVEHSVTYTTRLQRARKLGTWAVLDIETDGLDANELWVVGLLRDGERNGEMLDKAQASKTIPELVRNGWMFVIHNAGFDVPALRKHGIHIPYSQVVDSMLLSYVRNPALEGGHSLANLGPKMDYRQALIDAGLLDAKAPKGEEYLVPPNPVMYQYCATDLRVTRDSFEENIEMIERDPAAWALFAGVEMPFLELIDGMEHRGMQLDEPLAELSVGNWQHEREALAKQAQALVGYVPGKTKEYKKGSHKRNGVTTYNHCELALFNPGSNAQIAWALQRMGWEPTEFTPTGAPKVDAAVLKELSSMYELAGLLTQISRLDKLSGMVQGYLDKVTPSGQVHGSFNQCLTMTGRLSSSNPNLQNVPTRGEDGAIVRSMFTAPEGYVVVGDDLSNIEGRVLAHLLSYFEGEHRLAETFRAGVDFHQANADAWGVTRGDAKTLLYACVPHSTQILTLRGWLSHDEVRVGDRTLGYNPATGLNEWTRITHVHHYDSAPLVRYATSRRSFVSTPNHRWITDRGYRQSRRSKRRFDRCFTSTENLTSEHRIINTSLAQGGGGANLAGLVHKYERDHDWSSIVLRMTVPERWAFFSANIATDGHMTGDTPHFSQDRKQVGLTDAMELCGFLLGYNVTRRTGSSPSIEVLSFNVKPHTGMQTMERTELAPAPVWCVTTELGSWTMKQDGYITLTSNSLYGAGPAKVGGGDAERGQELLDMLDKNMPAITALKNRVWAMARKRKGLIHTWFGRRLYYPDITSRSFKVRGRAERQVFNAVLQGTAADILKLIAIDVETNVTPRYDGWLVAQVHDELQWYIMCDQAQQFAEEIEPYFAYDYLSHCPTCGEAKVGANWNEVH
jgi:DNA polymerase I-like protein with 3'-5' exonuclease and polymerase domains